MKILHITSWYPNRTNSKEALFIQRHIEALEDFVESQSVVHLEVKTGKLKLEDYFQSKAHHIILHLPTRRWFIIELTSTLLLIWLLIRFRIRHFDLANVHIAYPNLTYWHWIKRWVKIPIIITEHWSAYHFNFGVKKELPRIQKIFKQKIPVVTVSQALALEIKSFAKANFSAFIVPNVVDDKLFFIDHQKIRQPFLFMVSQWKSPKTPILVMQAFLESEVSKKFTLKIGGYGPEWEKMKSFVSSHQAEEKIQLLGILDSHRIAECMQTCSAFLHPTDYETFSVVCAEAVACGAFVISPDLGGIPEVVGTNGHLLNENTLENWKRALNEIPEFFEGSYVGQFSPKTVGEKYKMVLNQVISDFSK